MPNLPTLPPGILNHLATEVGNFIPSSGFSFTFAENLTIGESLPIWSIDEYGLGTEKPLFRAFPTGMWHHQIFKGDQPVAFARSVPRGPQANNWSIVQVFESEISRNIDAAISFIDETLHDQRETRLLILPRYFLELLWMVAQAAESNQVVVAEQPTTGPFELRKIYSESEFFNTLLRMPLIDGLR